MSIVLITPSYEASFSGKATGDPKAGAHHTDMAVSNRHIAAERGLVVTQPWTELTEPAV